MALRLLSALHGFPVTAPGMPGIGMDTPTPLRKNAGERLWNCLVRLTSSTLCKAMPLALSVRAVKTWQETLRSSLALTRRKRLNKTALHERFFSIVLVNALGYKKRRQDSSQGQAQRSLLAGFSGTSR